MKLKQLALAFGCALAAIAPMTAIGQDVREPIPGRTQPVENTSGKTIKIALISFPESNEFFSAVKVGSDGARDVLAGYNAVVDYVTVNEFTQDAVNAAGRATMLQGYDAMAFLPLDNGACPLIKEAVAAGIKTAVFITTADCAEESGALFFHGEDLADAWGKKAVPKLIEMINADPRWAGKECRAGVITGAFSVPTHETMRLAILDGLKGTNVTPVSDGVEIEQDLSKVGPAARTYLTGNPEDLCALIVNIGDAGAAAAALTDEQAKQVYLLSADFTLGGVEQMRKGKQDLLLGQDPFGEAYDTAILLYNAVVTGEDPGFYQPVTVSLMTPDNIDELMKAQAEGTAPTP
ncbi:MAG: substrate-binding domain-containing protein [Devosia sp.]|uniref:sugar ABC transporter substrate-binding protein n=1 Tax=Devosia sp. TaxID=1871048 RepID=UPI001A5B127F|nr:substrate-binding domain-containing protein [Devosia sp.]MBL8600046.1 substrate-binding domain-containing protein [Devosia sp.]